MNRIVTPFERGHTPIAVLKDWLRAISYKPNFRFEIEQDIFHREEFILSITMVVPDSNEPGNTVDVVRQSIISDPWWRNRCRFQDCVIESIKAIEAHEFDEWFRVDGVRIVEPHADV